RSTLGRRARPRPAPPPPSPPRRPARPARRAPAAPRRTPPSPAARSPPHASFAEKELLRSPPQQPVSVRRGQTLQPRPHQVAALPVGVYALTLERAVTLPHTPACPERLHHLPDQRPQVVVGRLPLAQGVECPHLYHNALVGRQGAQGLDVLVADGAV